MRSPAKDKEFQILQMLVIVFTALVGLATFALILFFSITFILQKGY